MNMDIRHAILDIVMSHVSRADVEFDNRGQITVTTWSQDGYITDTFNSWNFESEQEFFEDVKLKLR